MTHACDDESGSLAFTAADADEFVFDTGVLRGRLRAGGRPAGLTSVIHVPTGVSVDRSHGLVNHYRVFTAGERYGRGMRDTPGEAHLLADGGVEALWPATGDRPFELRVIYRWAGPAILDIRTVVTAETDLKAFEVFLASYFQDGFTHSLVYSTTPGNSKQGEFITADRTFGDWLIFPRDSMVIHLIRDGRWDLPPSPIEWTVMQPFCHPLGIRRDHETGLTALLMSPPGDCFAVSTPYGTEGHYSLYLSLFGRDLRAGETVVARSRLLIGLGLSEEEIRDAYRVYVDGLDSRP